MVAASEKSGAKFSDPTMSKPLFERIDTEELLAPRFVKLSLAAVIAEVTVHFRLSLWSPLGTSMSLGQANLRRLFMLNYLRFTALRLDFASDDSSEIWNA
ncbi:hypothetical protein [Thioclava sp. F36-6]|uniref:hypothetical protein n=1 Tax=Thioclava sp. F36-6 TaxID=1915316 RepID=UPI0011BAC457|nr:hypothetical protein [Thioclava sp. F36-6]